MARVLAIYGGWSVFAAVLLFVLGAPTIDILHYVGLLH
jgi:hypothetical protein